MAVARGDSLVRLEARVPAYALRIPDRPISFGLV